MISLSRMMSEIDTEQDDSAVSAVVARPRCFGITIFTQRYEEVRDFYVDLLSAFVIEEKAGRVCEMELAGMPFCLRKADHGEDVSYFHLQLVLRRQESVLAELRRRGIIVTTAGPFTNFRDPEGRVVKLSQERVPVI